MEQNQLFEAIKIIAEQVIKNENIQRTVIAIVKSERKENGSIDVDFQGAIIEAFPMDSGSVYHIDDMVYILLPDGKISGSRLIMGLVSKSRTATVDINDYIEKNVITTGKNYFIEPLDYELTPSISKQEIKVDPSFGVHHNQGMSHIRLCSEITTKLTNPSNTFGLRVYIKYKGIDEPVKHEFNQFRMEGAIANLIGNKQSMTFDIEIGKTVEDAWGEYFCTSPITSNEYIIFKNTRLELLSDVINDIISDKRYEVSITSDKGTIFKDDEIGVVTLTCAVRGNQMNIDPEGTNLIYSWYLKSGESRVELTTTASQPNKFIIGIEDIDNVQHYECDVKFK